MAKPARLKRAPSSLRAALAELGSLVERGRSVKPDELYPWNACNSGDPLPAHDSPPTGRQVKIRVADGVSRIDASGDYDGTKHSRTP